MKNAPMTAQAFLLARWEVLWLSEKGTVIREDCGTDFYKAKRLYGEALLAGEEEATLRCKNVGFPPPDKYYRKRVVRIEKVDGRRVRRVEFVNILERLNRRGMWWCPYCIEMRKFERRDGYDMDGTYIEEPHLACPMCGMAHTNYHVRCYNPLADMIRLRGVRRRRKSRRKRRRRVG